MKYRVRINNPVIGVPKTFVGQYTPEQFEMLDHGGPAINGVNTYERIFIRWKPETMPNIDKDGVITYSKIQNET